MSYLNDAMIEEKLLRFKNFFDLNTLLSNCDQKNMKLFGNTIKNLNILPFDGSSFSLLETLNFTATIFGKRQLKKWICSPLLNVRKKDHFNLIDIFYDGVVNFPLMPKKIFVYSD